MSEKITYHHVLSDSIQYWCKNHDIEYEIEGDGDYHEILIFKNPADKTLFIFGWDKLISHKTLIRI